MNKFNKIVTSLFAGLLATVALASCKKVDDEEDDKTTITFVSTMSETKLKPIVDAVIEDFMAENPDIEVVHTHANDYDTLRDGISNQISVDSQPDIAYCYPDHVALYNKAKKVVALDDYINNEEYGFSTEQKEDFVERFYEEGTTIPNSKGETGAMYALPFLKSTEVLYYNKSYFDKHSLSVPTTWTEMEQVCAQIKSIEQAADDVIQEQIDAAATQEEKDALEKTKTAKNCVPLGYDSEANLFITYCEQAGIPYTTSDKTQGLFLFDNPEAQAMVKMFTEWYQKGYMTTQTIINSFTSSLFTQADHTKNPYCYMCIGSSAGASNQRAKNKSFEVECAQIPQVDPTNPKVISQGPSLCVFKHKGVDNEERILASWKLVKYLLTNVNMQIEFSLASGYVPSIKSVDQNEIYTGAKAIADGYDNLAQKSALFCIDQASKCFTSPAFVGSSEARSWVGKIISNSFANSVSNGVAVESAQLDSIIDAQFKQAISECKYAAGID